MIQLKIIIVHRTLVIRTSIIGYRLNTPFDSAVVAGQTFVPKYCYAH